jgi:hypothetical protein
VERKTSYAATESGSMIAEAIAFPAYASYVSWVMMLNALWVTICAILLCLGWHSGSGTSG